MGNENIFTTKVKLILIVTTDPVVSSIFAKLECFKNVTKNLSLYSTTLGKYR
jgi:hypothetical protein